MALDLSVIVSTRDNLEGAKRIVNSLYQQTFSSDRYEVIIADDSKGKETTEYFSADNHPPVPTFVTRSEGRGYQYGRTKTFKNADGDILLYLNDTCIAPATLLESHYNAHSKAHHRIIRGPIMPLKGDVVKELKPFTAPQLDFTIINSSISKLGVAQLETFDEQCNERFHDNEMYWRLRRANFTEIFRSNCYCFQNYLCYQEQSLTTLRNRAERFASSAANYYFSKPHPETLDYLRLDIPLNCFQQCLHNSFGYSFASSMMGGKLEGKGWIQSTFMDAVFSYLFYEKLKGKLKNFR